MRSSIIDFWNTRVLNLYSKRRKNDGVCFLCADEFAKRRLTSEFWVFRLSGIRGSFMSKKDCLYRSVKDNLYSLKWKSAYRTKLQGTQSVNYNTEIGNKCNFIDHSNNCLFFIPCIIVTIFTILNQQNSQTCSKDLYCNIALIIPICFGPQGTIERESNQSNIA